jgi:hypothetical protein
MDEKILLKNMYGQKDIAERYGRKNIAERYGRKIWTKGGVVGEPLVPYLPYIIEEKETFFSIFSNISGL